ncbi:hypothetical protein [Clostridium paridis]|nr:hypothetical protein [Clostridium paridis]
MIFIDTFVKTFRDEGKSYEKKGVLQKYYKPISNLIYIYGFIVILFSSVLVIGLLDSSLLLLLKISDIVRDFIYNKNLVSSNIGNIINNTINNSYFMYCIKVILYISRNVVYIIIPVIIISIASVWIATKKNMKFDYQGKFLITISILNSIYEKSNVKLLPLLLVNICIYSISRFFIYDNSKSYGVFILISSIYLILIIYKKIDKEIININKTFILVLITPILIFNTINVSEISSYGIIATVIASFFIIDRVISLIMDYNHKILNGGDLFFIENCLDYNYIDKIYKNLNISSLESAENMGKLKEIGILNLYKGEIENINLARNCLLKYVKTNADDVGAKQYLAIAYYKSGEEFKSETISLCEEIRNINTINRIENLVLIQALIDMESSDYEYMNLLLEEVNEKKNIYFRYIKCKVEILSCKYDYYEIIKEINKLKMFEEFEDIYIYLIRLEMSQTNIDKEKVRIAIEYCEKKGLDYSILVENIDI